MTMALRDYRRPRKNIQASQGVLQVGESIRGARGRLKVEKDSCGKKVIKGGVGMAYGGKEDIWWGCTTPLLRSMIRAGVAGREDSKENATSLGLG
jgi:hypothetical protein